MRILLVILAVLFSYSNKVEVRQSTQMSVSNSKVIIEVKQSKNKSKTKSTQVFPLPVPSFEIDKFCSSAYVAQPGEVLEPHACPIYPDCSDVVVGDERARCNYTI